MQLLHQWLAHKKFTTGATRQVRSGRTALANVGVMPAGPQRLQPLVAMARLLQLLQLPHQLQLLLQLLRQPPLLRQSLLQLQLQLQLLLHPQPPR